MLVAHALLITFMMSSYVNVTARRLEDEFLLRKTGYSSENSNKFKIENCTGSVILETKKYLNITRSSKKLLLCCERKKVFPYFCSINSIDDAHSLESTKIPCLIVTKKHRFDFTDEYQKWLIKSAKDCCHSLLQFANAVQALGYSIKGSVKCFNRKQIKYSKRKSMLSRVPIVSPMKENDFEGQSTFPLLEFASQSSPFFNTSDSDSFKRRKKLKQHLGFRKSPRTFKNLYDNLFFLRNSKLHFPQYRYKRHIKERKHFHSYDGTILPLHYKINSPFESRIQNKRSEKVIQKEVGFSSDKLPVKRKSSNGVLLKRLESEGDGNWLLDEGSKVKLNTINKERKCESKSWKSASDGEKR